VPLILLCAAITFPIGVLGCALGLPGGNATAQMLLALGLKPRVVAGSSRFLVLCFMFGSFVAHIITGNLTPTLALGYGLINLGVAPLGMLLFTKLRVRGHRVILLSLLMGATGWVIILLGQVVPLVAEKAGHTGVEVGQLAPGQLSVASRLTVASRWDNGNSFRLDRFCKHRGAH
jgi:hypothetical protein